MTTSTLQPPLSRPDRRPRSRKGFTLVEVLIGAGLAAFILTAVMTTFLFLGRSGVNIQNYNDMESQSRQALEQFAQDVRQASAITWNSTTDLTLIVDSQYIRYFYSPTAPGGSALTGNFLYRIPPSSTVTSIPASPPRGWLRISGVATFRFKAYNITGTELSLADLAAAGRQTKQLQISLEAQRTSTTVARATNLVLSARYILRNKRVTT